MTFSVLFQKKYFLFFESYFLLGTTWLNIFNKISEDWKPLHLVVGAYLKKYIVRRKKIKV